MFTIFLQLFCTSLLFSRAFGTNTVTCGSQCNKSDLTMGASFGDANFDEVRNLKNNNTVYLIDVREDDELKETGTYPNSLHIPLGEVESVLSSMNPEDFKKKFNRDKPSHETPLVFACKAGRRGATASETAVKLGFKNVKNYSGGWLDWASKIKQ